MSEPTVYIVDDDPVVLKSLHWLFESARLSARIFSSAADFLQSYDSRCAGCLILDVRMPGMTGLELQKELANRDIAVPIIFMTGHGDVPACTESFRNGAFDFIEKPADDGFLINRVRQAIAIDAERCEAARTRQAIEQRIATLTPREREIMNSIIIGKAQKQIASEFGISFQTAAKHRAKVLEKLQARNDVEVVRLLLLLAPEPDQAECEDRSKSLAE